MDRRGGAVEGAFEIFRHELCHAAADGNLENRGSCFVLNYQDGKEGDHFFSYQPLGWQSLIGLKSSEINNREFASEFWPELAILACAPGVKSRDCSIKEVISFLDNPECIDDRKNFWMAVKEISLFTNGDLMLTAEQIIREAIRRVTTNLTMAGLEFLLEN